MVEFLLGMFLLVVAVIVIACAVGTLIDTIRKWRERKKDRRRNQMSDLNIFKKGYYSWRCPLRNIAQFFRNCKYAWQRATKGYSDWDAWDLDWFYNNLLVDSLREFAKETLGYPCNDSYENWVNKINFIADKIESSKRTEEEYLESDFLDTKHTASEFKEFNNVWMKKQEEANKETSEGYKELGEIIRHLWW